MSNHSRGQRLWIRKHRRRCWLDDTRSEVLGEGLGRDRGARRCVVLVPLGAAHVTACKSRQTSFPPCPRPPATALFSLSLLRSCSCRSLTVHEDISPSIVISVYPDQVIDRIHRLPACRGSARVGTVSRRTRRDDHPATGSPALRAGVCPGPAGVQ
ncbi:hypothetical protein M432DRAFT_135136 [Thermoascus aurantiacus ATCC 26904]